MERKPTYAELIAAGVSPEEARRALAGIKGSVYPEEKKETLTERWRREWQRDVLEWIRQGRTLEKICWEMMFHHPQVTFGEFLEFWEQVRGSSR